MKTLPLLNYLTILVLIIFLISSSFVKLGFASLSNKTEFFDEKEKPHGISYETWAAKWWNWIISIPMKDNPRLDSTGIKCNVEQNDNTTWFLAQISHGYAERHCSIPPGKSILVPILTGECDYLSSPEIYDKAGLLDCASGGIKGAVVHANLDGEQIKEIKRIVTPLFNTTIYPDNIFSSVSSLTGDTQAVTDGYYIFIKSLPPGLHTLDFSASAVDNPIIGSHSFSYGVKYILDIGPIR